MLKSQLKLSPLNTELLSSLEEFLNLIFMEDFNIKYQQGKSVRTGRNFSIDYAQFCDLINNGSQAPLRTVIVPLLNRQDALLNEIKRIIQVDEDFKFNFVSDLFFDRIENIKNSIQEFYISTSISIAQLDTFYRALLELSSSLVAIRSDLVSRAEQLERFSWNETNCNIYFYSQEKTNLTAVQVNAIVSYLSSIVEYLFPEYQDYFFLEFDTGTPQAEASFNIEVSAKVSLDATEALKAIISGMAISDTAEAVKNMIRIRKEIEILEKNEALLQIKWVKTCSVNGSPACR